MAARHWLDDRQNRPCADAIYGGVRPGRCSTDRPNCRRELVSGLATKAATWFGSIMTVQAINSSPVLHPAPYITIALAATITGLTEKAIRRKIEEGKWLEGREYRRSPDGGIFISLKGFTQWVEKATA